MKQTPNLPLVDIEPVKKWKLHKIENHIVTVTTATLLVILKLSMMAVFSGSRISMQLMEFISFSVVLSLAAQVNSQGHYGDIYPAKPLQPPPDQNKGTRIESDVQIVLGIFGQEVANSWFYETYYPVILKIPIPDWSQDSYRLNRSLAQCQNDELVPNYLCPVQEHLENLLVPLFQNTRFFKNIYKATPPSAEPEDIYDSNFSCEKVRSHFANFATSMSGINEYVKALNKKCPLARGVNLIEMNLSSANSQRATVAYDKFTKLHQSSLSKLKAINDNESSLSDEWKFSQMVGYTTLQNAYTLSNYVDSIRWANAYSTCQASRLDINLFSPSLLMKLLHEVSYNLTNIGYNFSIPFDELLTHYYKLPLTDCVLGVDGESEAYLVLRLIIPVIKNELYYKLFKLSKVPFYIRNIDHNSGGSICEIKNYREDDFYLVEYSSLTDHVTSMMKAPLTCGPYHVCRILDPTHRDLVDPCVEGVLSKDEELTKLACSFQCTSIGSNQNKIQFPIVTQLGSNKFAITGAMYNETKGANVSIKCHGKIKMASLRQELTDEATLITLPCPCEILIGKHRRYLPDQPCENTRLQVVHVTHVVDGKDSSERKSVLEHLYGAENNTYYANEQTNWGYNSTGRGLPAGKKQNDKDKEEVEENSVEDDHLISSPFADNRINGSEEFNIIVLNVSDTGNHVVIWIIGCFLLVSNILTFYALHKSGLLMSSRILLSRS